jgi:putative membrane protein
MSIVFAILAALIHVYIFVLESLLWGKPRTNKVFGMDTHQAEVCRPLAFNQGFYNLFLALAIIAGLWSRQTILVDYGMASIGAAGAVLFMTAPRLRLAARVQLFPAILYVLARQFWDH